MAQYALGLDIGGTFTDIVVYDQSRAVSYSHKELTTTDAPYRGVVAGIKRLFEIERLAYRDVTRMVHATTLFTNALIERKHVIDFRALAEQRAGERTRGGTRFEQLHRHALGFRNMGESAVREHHE